MTADRFSLIYAVGVLLFAITMIFRIFYHRLLQRDGVRVKWLDIVGGVFMTGTMVVAMIGASPLLEYGLKMLQGINPWIALLILLVAVALFYFVLNLLVGRVFRIGTYLLCVLAIVPVSFMFTWVSALYFADDIADSNFFCAFVGFAAVCALSWYCFVSLAGFWNSYRCVVCHRCGKKHVYMRSRKFVGTTTEIVPDYKSSTSVREFDRGNERIRETTTHTRHFAIEKLYNNYRERMVCSLCGARWSVENSELFDDNTIVNGPTETRVLEERREY